MSANPLYVPGPGDLYHPEEPVLCLSCECELNEEDGEFGVCAECIAEEESRDEIARTV